MVWKIRSKFTQGLLIFHCHKSGHTIWSRETEIGKVFDFVNTAKSFTATDFFYRKESTEHCEQTLRLDNVYCNNASVSLQHFITILLLYK